MSTLSLDPRPLTLDNYSNSLGRGVAKGLKQGGVVSLSHLPRGGGQFSGHTNLERGGVTIFRTYQFGGGGQFSGHTNLGGGG